DRVEHDEGDALLARDPGGDKPGGKTAGGGVELGIAERAPRIDKGNAVAVALAQLAGDEIIGGVAFVHLSLLPGGAVYPHSRALAIAAPSASARNFAQTMLGATIGDAVAAVPKPQSLPAITRSRPTMPA